jgi:Lon-like ATP-dependent protease
MSLFGGLRPHAVPRTRAAATATRACWQLARPRPGPPDEHTRTFGSSGPRSLARTAPRLYPRWVNTKPGQPPVDEVTEERAEEHGTVRASADDAAGAGSGASDSGGAPPASSSSSSGSGSDSPPSSGSGSDAPPNPTPTPATSISKQSVPEHYPQMLALPIARRPLFPGYYKAVVVRNPAVVAAIKEMMRRGQPYLGAFLLKDENSDADVVTDPDAVHPVGVFAQITSVFAANAGQGEEEGLTAVLYPHRRIKITDLIKSGQEKAVPAKEDTAATPDESKEALPTPPATPTTEEASELGWFCFLSWI